MRKWHRWLSFIFGAFLLFISVTGVASHLAAMYARGAVFETEEEERGPPRAPQATVATPGQPAAAPEARPAPNPKRKIVGFLHHLHSGEEFGPVGVIISLLSGIAMIFFSFSGLWMYFQMMMRRNKADKRGFFWD
jgi:hypothetical protein